jgi:hypothetical protein
VSGPCCEATPFRRNKKARGARFPGNSPPLATNRGAVLLVVMRPQNRHGLPSFREVILRGKSLGVEQAGRFRRLDASLVGREPADRATLPFGAGSAPRGICEAAPGLLRITEDRSEILEFPAFRCSVLDGLAIRGDT